MAEALELTKEEKKKETSTEKKKVLEKYLTLCLEAVFSYSSVRHTTFD